MEKRKQKGILATIVLVGAVLAASVFFSFLGPIGGLWTDRKLRQIEDAALAELGSDDEDARRAAARRLAEIGSARAVPHLIRLQGDWARRQAPSGMMELHYTADALAGIGEPALPALLEVLEDGDDMVRFHAKVTLERMGPRALPALARHVDTSTGEGRAVAADAVVAISLAHGRRAAAGVPVLRGLLASSDLEKRRAAVVALGRIGPEAFSATGELLDITRQETGDLRAAAVEAIRRIRGIKD